MEIKEETRRMSVIFKRNSLHLEETFVGEYRSCGGNL